MVLLWLYRSVWYSCSNLLGDTMMMAKYTTCGTTHADEVEFFNSCVNKNKFVLVEYHYEEDVLDMLARMGSSEPPIMTRQIRAIHLGIDGALIASIPHGFNLEDVDPSIKVIDMDKGCDQGWLYGVIQRTKSYIYSNMEDQLNGLPRMDL